MVAICDLSVNANPRPLLFQKILPTLAVVFVWAFSATAAETDPYTNRHLDLNDSLTVLDAKMNKTLNAIAASWTHGNNEELFINEVFKQLAGVRWTDKYEKWATSSPEVELLPVHRSETVFARLPFLAVRGANWGLARTINVDGTYIGSDKIGHFFSQGRKFYSRYRRLGTVELAAERTAMWEAFIWGRTFSSVYSNADLIANYEGFLFYRGLFNDNVVSGKSAMFRWQDERLVRQRPFTWADHVNALWDELFNPNVYIRSLLPHIEQRMLRLCDDYANRPERYRKQNLEALRERYPHLGMRDAAFLDPDTFLSKNCPE